MTLNKENKQDSDVFNVYQISGEIDNILKNFTKTQQRQVLAQLSASLGYRLVPFGVPVGQVQRGNGSTIVDTEKIRIENKSSPVKTEKRKKEKLPWKKDEKWKDISSRREAIVKNLKTLGDGTDEQKAAKADLLKINAEMKSLKAELRGTYNNTSGSSSSTSEKGKEAS